MQTIFKKCPVKGNDKLSILFRLILRGLNLPAGSDTSQNKILRGIRPCRTSNRVVSDPAVQETAGYQIPCRTESCWVSDPSRTMAELCTFYSRGLFCGVWYPAERHSVGPDTPPNNVLRVIRPRGTKSCGVSNPKEQLLNTNISANQNRIQKYFRVWIWDYVYGVNSWKKLEVENLVLVSL
jgi:hypothetical protein